MGIETPADYGGSESSFTSAIIAIEELAKIDPSVSVMCDVHNTLVNTIFRKYATKAQQEEFLPRLSSTDVRGCTVVAYGGRRVTPAFDSSAASVFRNQRPGQTPSPSKCVRRRRTTIGYSMDQRCGSPTRMRLKSFVQSHLFTFDQLADESLGDSSLSSPQ